MMLALGATNDAEFASFFGVGAATVSAWRARGVSKQARRQFAKLRSDVPQLDQSSIRRSALGNQVMYEGLCLAIWLAPSLDAQNRRFGAAYYSGAMRQYASFFSEIELACAEQVEQRRAEIGGNAADAFDSLTRDDPVQLFETVLDRAKWWRYGDPDYTDSDRTLHDRSLGFRHEGGE